eukprot:7214904-Alexandrium_andersonii.AAC.1
MQPSRASGTDVQAAPGPAQLHVRMRDPHFSMFKSCWRYSVRSVRFAARFDRYSVHVSPSASLDTVCWAFARQ